MIARASLRSVFEMRSDLISVWLMAVVLSALVLVCIHALQRAYAAAREPTIRLVDTKASPKLTLEAKQKWHLFLSHIWGTGQDQCATIKRQLLAYMPGLAVFLDVDDLHDIGELEAYVEQTAVMLVFVSKGYFKSKNCLREIRHTIAMRKPLVLVHDPVRGGATLEFIRKEECPLELHDATFLRPGSGEERDVITWHRIKVPACPWPHPRQPAPRKELCLCLRVPQEYQIVSIRLLAEQMLLGCPAYASYASLPLYIPGEVSRQKLTFTSPVVVFTSEKNPGALATAQMLQESYPELQLTSVPPAAVRAALGLSSSISSAEQLDATVMLLYLNDQTYLGDAGERLGTELLAVQKTGCSILMMHENDPCKGGCEFGVYFDGRTPTELLQGGIYDTLAISLFPGAYQPVSIALAIRVLQACEQGGIWARIVRKVRMRRSQNADRAGTGRSRRNAPHVMATRQVGGVDPSVASNPRRVLSKSELPHSSV